MIWTEDRDALLTQLHAEGHSYSIIGHRIGVSRNAAIGRAHRIGLTPRGYAVAVRTPAKYRRFKAAKNLDAVRTPTKVSPLASLPTEPLPKEDTPPADLLSIYDLEPHHCRWPYGDPKHEHGFCGKHAVIGLPYCIDHCRRSYQPAQPKPKITYVPLAARVFA